MENENSQESGHGSATNLELFAALLALTIAAVESLLWYKTLSWRMAPGKELAVYFSLTLICVAALLICNFGYKSLNRSVKILSSVSAVVLTLLLLIGSVSTSFSALVYLWQGHGWTPFM